MDPIPEEQIEEQIAGYIVGYLKKLRKRGFTNFQINTALELATKKFVIDCFDCSRKRQEKIQARIKEEKPVSLTEELESEPEIKEVEETEPRELLEPSKTPEPQIEDGLLKCEKCGKKMKVKNTSTARYTVFVLWRCTCGHQFLEKNFNP